MGKLELWVLRIKDQRKVKQQSSGLIMEELII